jgi:excisionase family DNA binding protein
LSGEERLYTPEEVAELLGVTHVAVRKWIKAGKVRVVKNIYGMYRIPESEVRRLVEERSSLKSFTLDLEELKPKRRS